METENSTVVSMSSDTARDRVCAVLDRRAVAEHLPLAWSKSTAEEEAAFIDRLETMVKGYHI